MPEEALIRWKNAKEVSAAVTEVVDAVGTLIETEQSVLCHYAEAFDGSECTPDMFSEQFEIRDESEPKEDRTMNPQELLKVVAAESEDVSLTALFHRLNSVLPENQRMVTVQFY